MSGFLRRGKVHKRHKPELKKHIKMVAPQIICAFCVLLVLFVIRPRFVTVDLSI